MWPNPQFPGDLVTFTEEILNGKLNFLCSENISHEALASWNLIRQNNIQYITVETWILNILYSQNSSG